MKEITMDFGGKSKEKSYKNVRGSVQKETGTKPQ